MKVKYCLIAIIMVCISLSCSRRNFPTKIETIDSTSRKTYEVVRDTVVQIPSDSSSARFVLSSDLNRGIYVKEIVSYTLGKNLKIPVVTIKNNVLEVKAVSDSAKLYLQLKDRYSELLIQKQKTITQTLEVNNLKWYQKTLMYIGLAAIFITTIIIIYKIKKNGSK